MQIERTQREGVIGRFMDRLQRTAINEEKCEVMGGRYKLVRWRGASQPDWIKLEQLCLQFRQRVLLPQNIVPPAGIVLEAPKLPNFKRMILVKTACEIAERSKLPIYRRIIGVVDDKGTLAYELPMLLRYYSCVRVISSELQLYIQESERMMHELGAPVIVGGEINSLHDCMLVISEETPEAVVRAPLLCTNNSLGGINCISSLQIAPPKAVLAACPEDISLQEFAGSLYEFSGVREYNFAAGNMLCDYRYANLTEIVSTVCNRIEQL